MLKLKPIKSFDNLRERVSRLLSSRSSKKYHHDQLTLGLTDHTYPEKSIKSPKNNISEYIDILSAQLTTGDLYIFGGLLRDLALYGKRGFNSDIDIVVDGDWEEFSIHLEKIGSTKNKFGGYRTQLAGWPVDIWSAKETWAIKSGHVEYNGISSLTKTTILNWDAILMNWRTKNFIHSPNYIHEITNRQLDIVLEENPNPLGMAVRVFRHLCGKDAQYLTYRAADYLARCTDKYSYEEIRSSEINSYRNSIIESAFYNFFLEIQSMDDGNMNHKFTLAEKYLGEKGITLSSIQHSLELAPTEH